MATSTSIFIKVFSSRPDSTFFMGLNFDTKTSTSPWIFSLAASSVSPTNESGGWMKQADGTCASAAGYILGSDTVHPC